MRSVKIEDVGETELLVDEQVDKFRFLEENERVITAGGRSAQGRPLLLGFKPVSSTVQGSSALQWTLPHCWSTLTSTINGPVLSNDNLVRAYNGTVTVQ